MRDFQNALLGAEFFESAGWEKAQWYAANRELLPADNSLPKRSGWAARFWSPIIGAEHLAARQRVGLFDLTAFTKIEVSGAGALAFLQRLAANQLDKPVGSLTYTSLLTPRGGLRADLTVTRLGDERFWVLTGGGTGCWTWPGCAPRAAGWQCAHSERDLGLCRAGPVGAAGARGGPANCGERSL